MTTVAIARHTTSTSAVFCFLAVFLIVGKPPHSTAQQFQEITEGSIVTRQGHTFSSSWGDYDGDGDLDLFVTNGATGNPNPIIGSLLFLNEGNYSFSNPISVGRLQNPSSGLWIDFDEDGDLDVLVSDMHFGVVQFRNVTPRGFVRIEDPVISAATSSPRRIAPVDYDSDGNLDLFVSQRLEENNVLLRNTGQGEYEVVDGSIITSDGGDSSCAEWADVDDDNDLDLFVCNAHNYNFLYENLGGGRFRKVESTPIVKTGWRTGSASWGDYDSDGDMDLVIVNASGEKNEYHRNDGGWVFTQITEGDFVNNLRDSGSSSAIDVDNDGDLDLFVTDLAGPNHLYLNDGFGQFTEVQNTGLGSQEFATASAAWGDIDRDGDLDVYLSNLTDSNNEIGKNQLFVNLAEQLGNNWLHFILKPSVSNNHAVGARIRVVANGLGNGNGIIREITGSSGSSSGGYEAAFGLGKTTMVDSVLVRWPSGTVQRLANIDPNQIVTVLEPEATIRHDAVLVPGALPDVQLDIEFANLEANLESVTVFYRTVNSSDFQSRIAEQLSPSMYRATIEDLNANIEYYIRGRTKNFDLFDGSSKRHLFFSTKQKRPRIQSIEDVPDDAGRHVIVNWFASSLDSEQQQVLFYSIWRAAPAGRSFEGIESSFASASTESVGLAVINSGRKWLWLVNEPALMKDFYYYTAETLYDRSLTTDGNQQFIVVAHTTDPEIFYISESAVGFSEGPFVESDYLRGNFPNPFNIATTIIFSTPSDGPVRIELFDVLGRRVRVVISETLPAGTHRIDLDSRNLAPGAYFYVLRSGPIIETRTLMLVK